jgi:hypothetical protein
MSVHIFTIAQELWIPGRDLAVDEIMERFTGRSSDIVTIPSKPIPTGYKVWAIAQLGYVLNVIYHRNGKGPIGSKAPTGSGINPTQGVVVNLLLGLRKPPIGLTFRYCVWLDNLFVSTTLLSYLRKLGYGAAGTARTNSGICQEFVAKKKAEQSNQYISRWGELWQAPTIDNLVLQTAWKDNNLVLFLSTIHDFIKLDPELVRAQQAIVEPGTFIGLELIVRDRKRSKATSTAARAVRDEFGSATTKKLAIPRAIDEYNYRMGQVDRGDQFRAGNPGLRRIRRGGWHALWRFLYNVVLCNSFLLSSYVGDRSKGCGHEKGQWEFRDKLIAQLFERAKASRQTPKRCVLGLKRPTLSPAQEHTRVRRAREQDCRGCSIAGQSREPSKKRRVLGEISGNSRPQKRPRSTVYGCEACDQPLCKEGPCWEAFHSQNRE